MSWRVFSCWCVVALLWWKRCGCQVRCLFLFLLPIWICQGGWGMFWMAWVCFKLVDVSLQPNSQMSCPHLPVSLKYYHWCIKMILLAALNHIAQIQVPLHFPLAPRDNNYGGWGREAQPSHFLLGLKKYIMSCPHEYKWHLTRIEMTSMAVIITAIDRSAPHRQGQAGSVWLRSTQTKTALCRKQP